MEGSRCGALMRLAYGQWNDSSVAPGVVMSTCCCVVCGSRYTKSSPVPRVHNAFIFKTNLTRPVSNNDNVCDKCKYSLLKRAIYRYQQFLSRADVLMNTRGQKLTNRTHKVVRVVWFASDESHRLGYSEAGLQHQHNKVLVLDFMVQTYTDST